MLHFTPRRYIVKRLSAERKGAYIGFLDETESNLYTTKGLHEQGFGV